MKRHIGTGFLWAAGALGFYYLLKITLWSLSIAISLLEPVILIGGAILLGLIGLHLRSDK